MRLKSTIIDSIVQEANLVETIPSIKETEPVISKKQAAIPELEKILVALKKGLPNLVTTINMSANQANRIVTETGEKHAEKVYKKLIQAANLVQESLTFLGKIKIGDIEQPTVEEQPEQVTVGDQSKQKLENK